MGYRNVIEAYLKELFADPSRARGVGAILGQDLITLKFFDRNLMVRPGLVMWGAQEAPSSISITVLRYLLFGGMREKRGQIPWVTFKDLKDASPFVGAFSKNVLERIQENFEGRPGTLLEAAISLGGSSIDGPGYDINSEFQALPCIRLRLHFNDRDELFPPKAVILFEGTIEKYLDIECIAALGWILADLLIEHIGSPVTFANLSGSPPLPSP